MAKGKGKSSVSAGSKLRKRHGPKRHLWKDLKPMVWQFGKLGLLTKYEDFESWQIAMAARGQKNTSRAEFLKFVVLSRKEKDEYFKNARK